MLWFGLGFTCNCCCLCPLGLGYLGYFRLGFFVSFRLFVSLGLGWVFCVLWALVCPLRLNAFFKTEATGKLNGLPVMRHESCILDLKNGTADSPKCEVPQAILSSMISARACAEEMLNDPSFTCLADLQRVLKNSASLLLSMDRSFRLELEWLATGADDQYIACIHASILACLPSATARVTLVQACSKLDALLASGKGKFCALRSQGEIKTVRKVLDKMVAGVPPDASIRNGGRIFEKAWDRFQYFIVADIPGTKALMHQSSSLHH